MWPSYLDLDLVLLSDIFYSSFIFSLQVSLSDLGDCFLKQLLIFYSLTIPSPDEDREVDLGTFVDKEEGDIDDESDVELDLDLDDLDVSSHELQSGAVWDIFELISGVRLTAWTPLFDYLQESCPALLHVV